MSTTPDTLSTFRTLAEEHFAAAYRAAPVHATQMGIHEYDHDLGDVSAEAIEAEVERTRTVLRQLESLDPQAWPVTERIDHALLTTRLRHTVQAHEELRTWQRNPGGYANLGVFGCYFLLLRDFAPRRERLAALLDRLRQVPAVLAQGCANVTKPVRIFTEVALEELPGGKVIFDRVIPAAAAAEPDRAGPITEAARAASVALEEYGEHLRSLRPHAREEFAVGREFYERLVREEHLLPYDAEQLREISEEWLAKTNEAMARLADQIEPGSAVNDVLAALKQEHPSSDELLAAYEREVAVTRQFVVDHHLVDLPEGETLDLIETPPPLRALIPYAAYMPPPPFEANQRGLFLVTPIDPAADEAMRRRQLAGHPRARLPIIALHEGYPGHHVQLTTANHLAPPLRKHFLSTLLAEGWAFYCEELMEELGYLRTPETRFMRLNAQRWRAARVIIDTGLHTRGMSLDEAVQTLVAQGLEEPAARAEVKRYTMMPTQPMSYLLGKLELVRLRQAYERQHEDYTLAAFHADLLRWGTIPPAMIERQWEKK